MNFYKKVTFLIISFLIILGCQSFGQKLEPNKRALKADHIINSKIMGKEYHLYFSFPASYSTQDTVSYPVLYVLDGKYMFSILDGTRVNLDFEDRIEDVIIVGVGTGNDIDSWQENRTYELTPTEDKTATKLASGGADRFLKCIKSEIIPFVDKHYKTNSDNGILGHSLAGLFTTYCLLNSPESFKRYGISSPSLMWKDHEISKQAEQFFLENNSWDISPTKVFVSVGGIEEDDMVTGMMKFSKQLENRNYKNIDLSWKSFEGESHLSVVSAMLSRALVVLYGKN